jgi:hypothetical protein
MWVRRTAEAATRSRPLVDVLDELLDVGAELGRALG